MTLPNRPGYTVDEKKPSTSTPTNTVEIPQVPSAPLLNQEAPLFPFVNYPPELVPPLQGVFKGDFEEVQARKNFVRAHRLLPITVEFLTACKKEGITPSADMFSNFLQNVPQPGSIDFGLDDFLASQGIDTSINDSEGLVEDKNELDEFLYKLEQLKEKYNEELEKLNRVCAEFCTRMFNLLREQSTLRPISEQEIQMKLHGIQQKFDYVKNQLRQNVCNAIVALEKQYNHAKKKRRALSKKATEHLSAWFFEHLNDPYPSEEEKSMLAAAGGLTITQVNNWFGNKRIRYKRKCLEEEAKRAGVEKVTSPSSDSKKGDDILVR